MPINRQPDLFREDLPTWTISDGAHSVFGGSVADQWLNCDLAPYLSRQMPNLGNTSAMNRGSAVHHILAETKYNAEKAEKFIGKTFFNYKVTHEDYSELIKKCSANAIEYINAQGVNDFSTLKIEQRVSPPSYPEAWATADLIVYTDRANIVLDTKTGYTEYFSHSQNLIGHVYASEMPEFSSMYVAGREIISAINQPTVPDSLKEKVWPFDIFRELKQKLLSRVEFLINSWSKHLSPELGPHCRSCRAKALCPAMAEQADKAAQIDPKKFTHDPKRMGQLVRMAEAMRSWSMDVNKLAYRLLSEGYDIDSYKLVRKRGSRNWIDPVAAAKKLSEVGVREIYEQKLISPAKAEAEVRKVGGSPTDIECCIEKRPGGFILVPAAVKRRNEQKRNGDE